MLNKRVLNDVHHLVLNSVIRFGTVGFNMAAGGFSNLRFGYVMVLICCSMAIMAQPSGKQIEDMIDESRELRALMQADPHRPIYHFVNPEGHAMPFDPNGAIYWNGKYHLGYIYQSRKRGKSEHVWGHAVSTDLLHWSLYPDMLNVQDGDIEKGIFSGGAFLSKDSVPHIMYHGEGSSSNLVAFSTDPDLKVWKKFDGNPVLKTETVGNPRDPKGGKYTAWDPEGWYDKKSGNYYQISGGNVAGFFKSKDMYKWEYLGDLIDPKNTMRDATEDLSCPDMFTIGGKSVLLFISHNIGTQYYIGDFANDKFSVQKHGRMNWPGGTFFAPEQLVDNKGRNIIWGWVLERKPKHLKNFGWSGIMSLPRVLTLSKQNDMLINPPAEVKSLRTTSVKETIKQVTGGKENFIKSAGTSVEIELELAGSAKSAYGVKVFCSPDGREETVIRYDPVAKELIIDFEKSAVSGPVKMPSHVITEPTLPGFPPTVSQQRAPFELKAGETLKLNIFLDRSIIEVFANGRQVITQVVYPELTSSNQIKLFSEKDLLTVKKLQVWQMAETNAY
ncbi:glycoside hydrolase family 32 protein [Flavitalea sp.]|nr:glycoside hydrolase family 32 protein [Flavitalea sp.]